jgi:hypothetical protein
VWLIISLSPFLLESKIVFNFFPRLQVIEPVIMVGNEKQKIRGANRKGKINDTLLLAVFWKLMLKCLYCQSLT